MAGCAGTLPPAERHAKALRLKSLQARLARVDRQLAAGTVSVVRGGKALLRKRGNLAAAGLDEDRWRRQWESARLFLTADGEKDKAQGNETIRWHPDEGWLELKLAAPLARLARLAVVCATGHPSAAALARAVAGLVASGGPLSVNQGVQLKVALKYARHPIWRSVVVPSVATLGGLHPVREPGRAGGTRALQPDRGKPEARRPARLGNATRRSWSAANVPRRIQEIIGALHDRGVVLPEYSPRYHDIDVAPMAGPFTAWYSERHGREPAREAVEALALLPDWVRWNGESPASLSRLRRLSAVPYPLADLVLGSLFALLAVQRGGVQERAGACNNGTANGDSDLKTAGLPSVVVWISKECWWP
jgi:hypothetical protein